MTGNTKINNNFILYNVVAWLYLATFVIGITVYNFSLPIFVLFIISSAIFVLPNYMLGLSLILGFTMIFEKFFTLGSLVIDDIIYKIYPLDIVIIFTTLSLIIFFLINREKISKVVWGVPERILLLMIVIFSVYFIISLFDINSDFAISFSTFKNYTFYPSLYFLTLFAVQDSQKLKSIIKTVFLSGIFIIGFIVFGIINGQGLWTEMNPLSTEGVRYLSSPHAIYLMLSFLIVITLVIYNKFSSKFVATLILWIWGIGIVGSLMRHVWLGLALGIITLFLISNNQKRKDLTRYLAKNITIIVMIFVLISLVFTLYSLQEPKNVIYDTLHNIQIRITSLINTNDDSSINWRVELWESAKNLWLTNPFFGIGFGKKINLELGDWNTFEEVRNMHNSPLAIMVQTGILGLFMFVIFFITTIRSSWKYIFKNENLKPYYIGILICIPVYLFCSLFQPYLEANFVSIFIWIFLGLLSTSRVINQKS